MKKKKLAKSTIYSKFLTDSSKEIKETLNQFDKLLNDRELHIISSIEDIYHKHMNKLKKNEKLNYHKSKITKLLNEMIQLPDKLEEINYEPESLYKIDTIQDKFQKLNHRLEILLM